MSGSRLYTVTTVGGEAYIVAADSAAEEGNLLVLYAESNGKAEQVAIFPLAIVVACLLDQSAVGEVRHSQHFPPIQPNKVWS